MNRILLCAAMLALPAQGAAQHIGFQAGLARTFQTAEETDPKWGRAGGVSLDLPLLDHVGLRLGGLYAEKGAAFDVDGEEGTLSLTYVELPAMLRIGGSLYGLIGAAVGINRGCTVTAASVSVDCSEIPGADINTIELGVAGGLGYRAGMSDRLSLTLEVLHNRGMTNVSEDDPEDNRNRSFSALAGVAIGLGG
ncbi:MAG: outer membrane beta-barrel protein [Gemmatimonadota bacterium]|nr:outer membrane beta-barrel protein [Gemmatimonadota bacterium]